MADGKEIQVVRATSVDLGSGSSRSPVHGSPEVIADTDRDGKGVITANADAEVDDPNKKKTWREHLAFFRTSDFWFILALGQVLAICITGTNTLTTLLVIQGTSIPAFQTLFNYVLLNAVYTTYTIYKYGFKKWGRMVLKDGWKCAYRLCPHIHTPKC
jgi:solute carrier family 35, member F1/2